MVLPAGLGVGRLGRGHQLGQFLGVLLERCFVVTLQEFGELLGQLMLGGDPHAKRIRVALGELHFEGLDLLCSRFGELLPLLICSKGLVVGLLFGGGLAVLLAFLFLGEACLDLRV